MAVNKYKINNLPFKFNPTGDSDSPKFNVSTHKTLTGGFSSKLQKIEKTRKLTTNIYEQNKLLNTRDFSNAMCVHYNRYDWSFYVCYSGEVEVYDVEFNSVTSWTPSNFDTITYLTSDPNNDRLFIWGIYGSSYRLYICDTSFTAISTYDFTGSSLAQVKSIAFNENSGNVYILNTYGEIESIDPTDGSRSSLYQFDDFSDNQSAGDEVYYSFAYLDGFLWYYYSKDNNIYIMDLNYNTVDYLDLENFKAKKKIISITVILSEENYYILLEDGNLLKMKLDLSLLWILKLETEIKTNPVTLTDMFGRSFRVFVDEIRYKQNLDKSYQLDLSVSY